LVTANPGCWMQIATALARMGERVAVAHTVQVLDASIRNQPVGQLLSTALFGPGTVSTRRVSPRASRPGS
jgi:glycolate oxidase iron-sulfur subunit